MRAASLLGVLVVAKCLVLAGTGTPLSGWAPIAFFWQDVLVALAAAALDALFRRPRSGWVVYAALVIYIAWSVPVAVVLGSPMTWMILRAARGPLADSVAHYLTAANIGRVAIVVAAGAAFPLALARWRRSRSWFAQPRRSWLAIAAAMAFVASGPAAAARVDTMGLDRNAITALLPSRLPAVSADPATVDWRTSPFPMDLRDTPGPGETPLARVQGSAKGFNVIVVVLESTAAQYLRPYGAAGDPMPNLTALSERALVFDSAYATYPESVKGLFSTLCSRYPAFGVPAEAHAGTPCASVAAELRHAGYRTALFHSGRFDYLGMDALIADKGFDLLEDAGAIGGNVRSSFGVDEPATVDRMLRWVDSLPPGAPFFATYLPVAGHHPYAAPSPGPFRGDTDKTRYENALHHGDESLGALMSGLQDRGLAARTLVMVFGDHGEAFGQHRGNMGHTLFIHEENVRVPYVIVVPGVTTAQTRVGDVVSLIDTAPTLLDLLGLPQPAAYQGTSMLRPGRRMALFFTDYSLALLGLRDGCWKYIFDVAAARSTLFDVCRDPGEIVDRSSDHPDRVAAYRRRVTEWSAAQQARLEAAGH